MPLRMAVISWLAPITTSWAQRDYRKDGKMTLFASSLVWSHPSATLLTNHRQERTMPYTAMLVSLALLVAAGAVAGRAQAAEANNTSQTITPTGGNQPHENMQPFLCVEFIISLFGIFPTQS